MSQLRELHEHIRDRVRLALGERSWSWLARAADVPRTTLVEQAAKPHFSVAVLVAVAQALDRPVAYFLPSDPRALRSPSPADDALDAIRRIVGERVDEAPSGGMSLNLD